jgi:hypothetical protein
MNHKNIGLPPPEYLLPGLEHAVKIHILSDVQVAIIRDRCSDPRQ